jgi:hypothetical protein
MGSVGKSHAKNSWGKSGTYNLAPILQSGPNWHEYFHPMMSSSYELARGLHS